MSALLVANERAASRFGSFNSISSRLGRAAGSVRFVESNQSNRSPTSRTGSVRSIQWMNWMNWIEWNERKTGKAPQSPLDQGAVIERKTVGSPFRLFHLLIFGVIFEKCVDRLNISRSTPPRARLYIVETESRKLTTDAGAKKNSRTEVKRVKTTIFIYVFVVFWSFRKILKKPADLKSRCL